jgi:hypothetical protein
MCVKSHFTHKKFPWMLKYNYFSIQGNFLTNILASKENFTKIKNSNILKCGYRKNSVCISCERLLFCWRIRMILKSAKNSISCPNKKQSFCALNTKITILLNVDSSGIYSCVYFSKKMQKT